MLLLSWCSRRRRDVSKTVTWATPLGGCWITAAVIIAAKLNNRNNQTAIYFHCLLMMQKRVNQEVQEREKEAEEEESATQQEVLLRLHSYQQSSTHYSPPTFMRGLFRHKERKRRKLWRGWGLIWGWRGTGERGIWRSTYLCLPTPAGIRPAGCPAWSPDRFLSLLSWWCAASCPPLPH